MKCPACSNSLQPTQAGDVEVDLCTKGCGGVWFDYKEIEKFDEPQEIAGEKLQIAGKPGGVTLNAPPRACPRCVTEHLVRQGLGTTKTVEIEVCWQCGGVWLDGSELAAIRGQYKDASERQAAGDAFVANALKTHIDAMNADTKLYIARRDADYRNRFQALLSSIRELL